ncbi:MAG: hypothetical protein IK076_03125, partial [Bacteroidales bacterium]|nr:hypothetical protein [Bacteroidales bacterium]
MKPVLAAFLSALLAWAPALRAQETLADIKDNIAPYGSIRSYTIFDSRDVKAGAEDMFYYVPMDYSRNLEGQDVYSNPSIKMCAITSQLGLDVVGLRYGGFRVGGKLEADFYLLNGTSASMRLRQAYVDMVWDRLGYMENAFSIRAGQAWHPMAADMPYCVNVESGSPFSPHTRSPQLMLDFTMFNGFSLTAGALYPMQYLPTGPSGPSENYIKYGLIPELYAGLSFKSKHFLARAGADFINLRPRYRTNDFNYGTENPYDVGSRVGDRLSMISPFAYLQVEADWFKFNAKSVLASGGDHLQLMSGYALYDWRDPKNYLYTPLRASVSFASFSVGRKLRFMCMGGYHKSLGTQHNLSIDEYGHCRPQDIYYFSVGSRNLSQMVRVTPTLSYNVGKLTVALEYD